MKLQRKSLKRQLQDLAHAYQLNNELDEIDLDEVAGWLISTQQYQRKPISLHQQCKLDLARALKEERFTDENGNEIRRMHAVSIKDGPRQLVFWADIKTAKPKHMRLSLQLRIPLKVAGDSGDGGRLPFRSALSAFFYSSLFIRVNI